jgi:hypothetical protein
VEAADVEQQPVAIADLGLLELGDVALDEADLDARVRSALARRRSPSGSRRRRSPPSRGERG